MTRAVLVPAAAGLGAWAAAAIVVAFVVWLVYLAVIVAKHVQAWPF